MLGQPGGSAREGNLPDLLLCSCRPDAFLFQLALLDTFPLWMEQALLNASDVVSNEIVAQNGEARSLRCEIAKRARKWPLGIAWTQCLKR